MPKVYRQAFKVRHYECDAYGHLQNANYLRYMQESAFNASADVGYDLARYRDLGSYWLIRYTDIEYQRPLSYGDHIVVETWVEDFRRVRSVRAYRFRIKETDEIAARAYTDWVYLDSTSMKPISIPDEMVNAFSPDGGLGGSSHQRDFTPFEIPKTGIYFDHRRVEWRDLDSEGHVNNAVYLSYIEECAIQVSAAYGWPIDRFEAERIGIVARRHQIEYHLPALLGDELIIGTWISDMDRSSAQRNYAIIRQKDNDVLARICSEYVWISLIDGTPVPIPAGMRDDFSENFGSGSVIG